MTLRSSPHPQDPTVLQSENRGPEAIAVVSVFSAVAAVTVGLRIISRRIKKADWLASDYTIILGLVGSWTVSGLVLAGQNPFILSLGLVHGSDSEAVFKRCITE